MYLFYQIIVCLSSFFFLIGASPEFQCPEHQIKKSGVKIQSPLYPKFPPKFRCWYNISGPQDQLVLVKFQLFDFPERLSLMKANYGLVFEDCAANYLQMWTPELGDKSVKFCGKELNGGFLLANGSMNLLFQSFERYFPTRSDGSVGFEAEIKFIPKSEYSKYENSFIYEEKDLNVSWGSQSYTFNIKAPIGKVPILELSKKSGEGDAKMSVTVSPNEITRSVPANNVLCEGEIKGKVLNSNFARFVLNPFSGNVVCNLKVKFVDPYPLCGGVHEMSENDKHYIHYLDYYSPDMCVWTVKMKNTKKGFDVMANLPLNDPNSSGVCNKDHVMGFFKENNQVIDILPATCGEKDAYYIEIPRSDTNRDLEATVITYVPYLFRKHRDINANEGNLQYFP